jgi:hypothetical protein
LWLCEALDSTREDTALTAFERLTLSYCGRLCLRRKESNISIVLAGQKLGIIFIELINGPFLYEHRSGSCEYGVGLKLAIDRGWL